jgi:hypothetical protein
MIALASLHCLFMIALASLDCLFMIALASLDCLFMVALASLDCLFVIAEWLAFSISYKTPVVLLVVKSGNVCYQVVVFIWILLNHIICKYS